MENLVHVLEIAGAVIIALATAYAVGRSALTKGFAGLAKDLLAVHRWMDKHADKIEQLLDFMRADPQTTKALVDRLGALEQREATMLASNQTAIKTARSLQGTVGSLVKKVEEMEGAPPDLDADALLSYVQGQGQNANDSEFPEHKILG